MGLVLHVYDPLTGQDIALKQIRYVASTLNFSLSTAPDSPAVALMREFQTLATLRHPNIIPVLDFGFFENNQPYYTMPLLQAPQPIDVYARQRTFRSRIALLIELFQALIYLHRCRIIHRDLKPGNVLIDAHKQLRVVDFGLSVEHGSTPSFAGTLAYMAPEIVESDAASFASDLYSAGVIAYELFAHRHPFQESMTASADLLQSIVLERPNLNFLDIPEAVRNVIGRLLEKKPADRYSTAQEALQALCTAAQQPLPAESSTLRDSFLRAARFVGRDQELKLLVNALREAKKRTGSCWVITGESGVGKSRLVAEVRIQALVRNFSVFKVQFSAKTTNLWQALGEAFQPLLLSLEVTSLEASILKPFVPNIEQLVGFPVKATPELAAETQQQRLIQTWVALLHRHTNPILFIMEDVQWASENLDLLHPLLMRTETSSMVCISTYRDDEDRYLYQQFPPHTRLLSLERLAKEHVATLTASILGTAGTRPDVVNFIQQHSEGNVFFIIDIIQALVEDQTRLDAIATLKLPTTALPEGLLASVRRRLDRLPGTYHPPLCLAAIIGRQIDLELLRYADQQTDYMEWLAACADAAILDVEDGTWRFAHDKIREGLLLDISDDEKTHLHHLAATAIEDVYSADDLYVEALLYHWQHAGNVDKVVEAAVRYSRREMKMAGLTVVREKLQTVLHTFADQLVPHQEAKIRLQLGQLLLMYSEHEAAHLHFQRCLTLLEDTQSSDYAGVLVGLAQVAKHTGNHKLAREQAQQAKAIYTALGDLPGLASVMNLLGSIFYVQMQLDEAKAYYQQSLEISEQLNDVARQAMTIGNLANTYIFMKQYDTAEQYALQSLTMAEDHNALRTITRQLNNLFIIYTKTKQFSKARTYAEKGLEYAQWLGQRITERSLLSNLAVLAADNHDYPAARDYFQRSAALSRELKTPDSLANALGALAQVDVLLNKWGDVRTSLLEWVAILNKTQNYIANLHGLYAAIELALAQDELEVAAEWYGTLDANASSLNRDAAELERLYKLLSKAMPLDKLTTAIETGRSISLAACFTELPAILERF